MLQGGATRVGGRRKDTLPVTAVGGSITRNWDGEVDTHTLSPREDEEERSS